jgi:5,10-methylenetetrahydromethanopterin reductase
MSSQTGRPRLIVAVHPDRPASAVAALAALAERRGYDGFWVADSQNLFRDVFVALTAVAEATERVQIATGVTNTVTRHPAVIAGGIGSIAELAPGRTALGIGVGETAVESIGERPANIAALEANIRAIKDLLIGHTATVRGRETQFAWRPPRVPIVVAATAPRALRVAGKLGDVAFAKLGCRPELIRYAQNHAAEGVREEGRSDEVELFLLLPIGVGPSDSTRQRVGGFAIALAVTTCDLVGREHWPTDLAPALDRLHREALAARERQGYVQWLQSPDCLRLASDELIEAFAVTGERSEVERKLAHLRVAGISGIVLPMISPDPSVEIEQLADELGLLPANRRL